jgi:DNA processing protein
MVERPEERSFTARACLRLHLTPGLGPILGRRVAEAIPADALDRCSIADLTRIEGIGPKRAATIHAGLTLSRDAASRELDRLERSGCSVVTPADPGYPPLLAEAPDAPLALFVRGMLSPEATRFAVAIVGSRACTAYGTEQAERFGAGFAASGIAVVSGGARGVDSAAHRAAIRVKGTTVVVLGCGLGHCYPPENAPLFDAVVEAGGAVVSEFPFDTGPSPENFPIRNRVISGLSLGVVVIEAPTGSGALITARHAVDHHGRDVFALPGRVDSQSSQGCHALIRDGGAALVTSPQDVIAMLESRARHVHDGTHTHRFAHPGRTHAVDAPTTMSPPAALLTATQRAIVDALDGPATVDELVDRTGLPPESIRVELTGLELMGALKRVGSRVARA